MKKESTVASILLAGLALLLLLCCLAAPAPLRADSITVGGAITQSVSDGTGPALNNPALNQIADGDSFTIRLNFAGAISAPGTYTLTGIGFLSAGGVAENNFASAILTIVQSGAADTLSLFAGLATGSGCNQGNELDLNFSIAAADLTSLNAAASQINGLLPLDLLEDDGVTDIHGTVTSFSNTSPASTPIPEPSVVLLLLSGAIASAIATALLRRKASN